MPTRNTKWLLAAVLYVASADQTMHQKIRTNHPVLIRRVDKVLSSFLAIVSHALFAIILALVLVVLVGSGTISAINAVSIGIAWLIAVVWMAKSDLIMRLPVPF
jgi:hypothetical protein